MKKQNLTIIKQEKINIQEFVKLGKKVKKYFEEENNYLKNENNKSSGLTTNHI